MRKENLYRPFEVDIRELEQFKAPAKSNSFFELIYIAEGTGVQSINGNRFNYRKGNLFLLTPEDIHAFDVQTTTKFFFLRFNRYYIESKASHDQESVRRVEYILQNASHRPGCILKNKADKPLISALIEIIMREHSNQQLYHSKIIEQVVNTIITVVARNIALKLPKNIRENTGEPVLDILHYIQQHIYEPQRLRSDHLSKHFGISLSYLGRYFKNQSGETLQQYISNYKLRLIETRLLHTDMRINEIASELNFTDESHLNRTFKKHKGISPTAYKKQFVQV